MKEFLERYLKIKLEIKEYENSKQIPLLYKGLYNIYLASTEDSKWIFLEPKKNVGMASLRRDRKNLEKIIGLNSALYLKKVNSYSKEVMLSEGIPFVTEELEIYLPFMGLLINKGIREIKPINVISFLTQKIIILSFYEKWMDMNVTKISEYLGVTKMSVSRCFDEIEYLEIPIIEVKGRTRVIRIKDDLRELWDVIKPNLRNPIIKTFIFEEDLKLEYKSGISALSEYTMLEDNNYKTYAVTKKEINQINFKEKKIIPKGEYIGSVVHEVGYFINFKNKNAIDPLSILLSLEKDELLDDRIKISIKEMLEEYVW